MNKLPNQIQNLIWYGQADIEQDSKAIITAVLTRGKFVDVRWLLQNYSQQKNRCNY